MSSNSRQQGLNQLSPRRNGNGYDSDGGYSSGDDRGRSRNRDNGRSRSRSRSPRGRAPSQEMLDRPVTPRDLPGLRLVDLQALAKNMGLNVPRNMEKMALAETIAFELDRSGPVYLDRSVANLTSAGEPRSPRNNKQNIDQQDLSQFVQERLDEYSSMNGKGYQSKWLYLISQVARKYGVNAADAARLVDPFYKAQKERDANEPGTQSRGRRNGRQERPLAFGEGGTTIGYADVTESFSKMNLDNGNAKRVVVDKQELDLFLKELTRNFTPEDFRSQWQFLISEVSRRFGLNAADSAFLLDPFYKAQKERNANEPGTQSRGRRNGQF